MIYTKIDALKRIDDRFFDTKSKIESLKKLMALSVEEKMKYIKKICSDDKVTISNKELIIFEAKAEINRLKEEVNELEKINENNIDEWIKKQIEKLEVKSTHREEYQRNRKMLDYIDKVIKKIEKRGGKNEE